MTTTKISAGYCAFLGILFCLAVNVAAFAEQPPSAEAFAKLPKIVSPKLSPDGKRILFSTVKDGEMLLVVGPAPGAFKEKVGLTPISTAGLKFQSFDWGNNESLMVRVRKTTSLNGRKIVRTRIARIDRDGGNAKYLKMVPNQWDYYLQLPDIVDPLENDPDHVLVTLDLLHDNYYYGDVHKVNVNTGERKLAARNTHGARDWLADVDGEIRIATATAYKGKQRHVWVKHRASENDEWETLQRIDYFDHNRMVPHRFHPTKKNVLLVSATSLEESEEGSELNAELFEYDTEAGRVTGPYVDQQVEQAREVVASKFPEWTADLVSHDRAREGFIFRMYSDVRPPLYLHLKMPEAKFGVIGRTYPQLEKTQLSSMERVEYEASDGYAIPALMTRPAGADTSAAVPFVVYPHGGPHSHDVWGFDNYVQFFASRGYGVFQPQFRGSTGFGAEHEEAGYGEWGVLIQRDIHDGVRWLVDEGIADPDRICIVGASFGGYAAALGLAVSPELFSCGVSINGVMDFPSKIDDTSNFLYDTINRAVMASDVDPETVSPLHLAENIEDPLLLIAGTDDSVVPYSHSRSMSKRLKRLRKKVTYIELKDGEHSRTNEAHEIQKLEAMEKFLAKHLGK